MPRSKPHVTIYEVADKAGVAISTVSRVLNESSDVADYTREHILNVIDELQYRPNRVAKALAQPGSSLIAIATPTITTPFHNSLLKGLRAVLIAADEERDLLLFDLGSTDPLTRLRSKLKGGKVDGLILAGIPVSPPLAKELKAFSAPVILIGNHHTDFDCFYWDNAVGAREATEHLLFHGHRRIGLIRAHTDGYVQLQRIQGYKAALKKYGVKFDSNLIQSGITIKHAGFSEEHGVEAMQQLLQVSPPISAVLASSDVQAIGAWKAIRDAGKRIPEDIALVGYDDVKTSYYIGLSSVDQSIEQIGRLAAERLLYRQNNPAEKIRIDQKIVPNLRVRRSSNYNRTKNRMHIKAIQNQLDKTLTGTEFSGLGKKYRGKVRDTYDQGDRLIMVTTDRISAFDHVLRQTIPFKGQVLNQLAAYFFEATSDIIPNQILSVPDSNVTIAQKCEPGKLEFVVRGYLVGHAWRTYRTGKRTLCGKSLPDGLNENDRLPKPILTPTTKAQVGHDEDISREAAIEQGLIEADTFDRLEQVSLALFQRGTELAANQGLILVDTKYEFGKTPDGEWVLIDEVHTPDSSRYFYLEPYETLLQEGKPQQQLSKEFVREWLMERGFQGKDGQVLPDLSDEFRTQVSARYIELFEKVTGKAFMPDTHPDPESRIREALKSR